MVHCLEQLSEDQSPSPSPVLQVHTSHMTGADLFVVAVLYYLTVAVTMIYISDSMLVAIVIRTSGFDMLFASGYEDHAFCLKI